MSDLFKRPEKIEDMKKEFTTFDAMTAVMNGEKIYCGKCGVQLETDSTGIDTCPTCPTSTGANAGVIRLVQNKMVFDVIRTDEELKSGKHLRQSPNFLLKMMKGY